MPSNKAAWIIGPKVSPLEVKEAPYPTPGPKDVIVQNAFVAINPLEYKIQDTNPPIAGKGLNYPTILGADLAGTILSVGVDVTSRKVGDRVIANSTGVAVGRPEMSAFQHYSLLEESSTTAVPDNVQLEKAVVLPLACDTAMAGLFVEDQLGLSMSKLGDATAQPPPPNSAVLIWGGSSSVGCCAIQMVRAAGYEVITTASKRNEGLCKSIGATQVFDHASPDVEAQIVAALQGKTVIGALDCIADDKTTIAACARILAKVNQGKKVVTVLNPAETSYPGNVEIKRLSIPALRASPAYDIAHAWMVKALADGSLQPKPDPRVTGTGLEHIQSGIDLVRKGVSATKIVVRLP